MVDVVARVIPYSEDQEHILRRLGGAVVIHWESLPDAMRTLLLRQATLMYDRDHGTGVFRQIDSFVEMHRGDMAKGRGDVGGPSGDVG